MQVREIIPLIDKGLTYGQIATKYKVSEATVNRWVKRLREAGYEIKNKAGRKHKPL